MSLQPKNLRY